MDGESPFLLKLTSGGTLWVAGTFYGSVDVGSGRVAEHERIRLPHPGA
ncbi:hypothetical protein [Sorangium atrum]|uniref:Uncharacterized protein n=1 Tax=Sorangium atrum TaxID=2995308 RepID=A0ABT5CAG3_9BACT|nr:hypothetical protein [Sorangium aterium]MDC0683424.1 hypothetical protein [Sorangium aterium]